MYTQSNQSNNLLLATDYASLCLTRYNMLTKCHAIELILHPSSKNSKKFLFEVVERESFSFFSFFFFFLEVHFQCVMTNKSPKERKRRRSVLIAPTGSRRVDFAEGFGRNRQRLDWNVSSCSSFFFLSFFSILSTLYSYSFFFSSSFHRRLTS